MVRQSSITTTLHIVLVQRLDIVLVLVSHALLLVLQTEIQGFATVHVQSATTPAGSSRRTHVWLLLVRMLGLVPGTRAGATVARLSVTEVVGELGFLLSGSARALYTKRVDARLLGADVAGHLAGARVLLPHGWWVLARAAAARPAEVLVHHSRRRRCAAAPGREWAALVSRGGLAPSSDALRRPETRKVEACH